DVLGLVVAPLVGGLGAEHARLDLMSQGGVVGPMAEHCEQREQRCDQGHGHGDLAVELPGVGGVLGVLDLFQMLVGVVHRGTSGSGMWFPSLYRAAVPRSTGGHQRVSSTGSGRGGSASQPWQTTK